MWFCVSAHKLRLKSRVNYYLHRREKNGRIACADGLSVYKDRSNGARVEGGKTGCSCQRLDSRRERSFSFALLSDWWISSFFRACRSRVWTCTLCTFCHATLLRTNVLINDGGHKFANGSPNAVPITHAIPTSSTQIDFTLHFVFIDK